MPDDRTLALYFAFFTEVGIINQLGRALFEARLPAGVSVDHHALLGHMIRLGDGCTPLDLARAFQVPKTTMTHRLAGLEALGFVAMAANPRDRRSKRVMLTEAGRRFHAAAMQPVSADIAHLAGQMPPERVEALLPGLRAMRQVLDAARDGERDSGQP